MADKEHIRIIRFFRSEYHRLAMYAHKLLNDTAETDGEDILQEVMLNVFNLADVTVPIDNLAAYLYQSLRNRVVDFLRKRRPQILSLDQELSTDTDLNLTDLIADPAGDASDILIQKERVHHLFAAIELLNGDEKALILETEFEGRTYRELSEKWNIPIGTLLSRKSRALNKLRHMLMDVRDQEYEKEK